MDLQSKSNAVHPEEQSVLPLSPIEVTNNLEFAQGEVSLIFQHELTEESFRKAVHSECLSVLPLQLSMQNRQTVFKVGLSLLTAEYAARYLAHYFLEDTPLTVLLLQALLLCGSAGVLTCCCWRRRHSRYAQLLLNTAYTVFLGALVGNDLVLYLFTQEATAPPPFSRILGVLVMMYASKLTVLLNYLHYVLIHASVLFFSLLIGCVVFTQPYATVLEVILASGALCVFTLQLYGAELVLRHSFVKLHKAEPLREAATGIEALLHGVVDAMSKLSAVAGEVSLKTKPKLLYVHHQLETILDQASSNRLYAPNISFITKDEEEKAYMRENYEDVHIERSRSRPPKPRKTEDVFSFKAPDLTDLQGVLRKIGKVWNFDSFFLKQCTDNAPIYPVGRFCIQRYSLDEEFQISDSKQYHFFMSLERAYFSNPYHNSAHAADVLISFMFFINSSKLHSHVTSLELLSIVLANLGHDVSHPGHTNRYLINTLDDLAYRYNDSSVLEMMHASLVFELLRAKKNNLLLRLSSEDWRVARRIVVELILATDMTKHFELISQLKSKIVRLPNRPVDTLEHRLDVLKVLMKSADIGHSAKEWHLHQKWSYLVVEEFFAQGDLEKSQGLPVSMFCDRDTTDVNKSQAGFIKNVAVPLYETLNAYLRSPVLQSTCVEQLHRNMTQWESQIVKTRKLSVPREEQVTDFDHTVVEYRRSTTYTNLKLF